MIHQKVRRRDLLRGLGASAALTPLVPLLSPEVEAADGDVPTRLLVFFYSSGTVFDAWRPTGGEHDFQLGGILESLAPFSDRLLVLEGLDQTVVTQGWISGHDPAMASLLTGREIMQDDTFSHGQTNYGWGGGISIDQAIAEHLAGQTAFASIEAGVRADQSTPNFRMSYKGAAQPVAPENDPLALYDRLFGELDLDQTTLSQLRARRASSIDYVLDDLQALQATVGSADRIKIEAHLAAVRDIETRLDQLGACQAPAVPGGGYDPLAEENFAAVGDAQMDLLVEALACDLTRIFSYEFSATQSTTVYWEVGIDQEHHLYNHENSQGEGMVNITRFIMENFAYFAEALRQRPEGAGNVLDNTLILGTSEHAVAGNHNYNDHPYIYVGGAGGGINAGLHWRHPNPDNNKDAGKNLMTAIRAVGVEQESLGQVGGPGGVSDRVVTEGFSEVLA